MSPVAPIAHLIAIAGGLFAALWIGGAIAPDLPSAETEPGVVVTEDGVTGSDPDSLYFPGPLSQAVTQTLDQLGPGAEVSSATIEPTTLSAADADGAERAPLASMPVDAPEEILFGIHTARQEAGVGGPFNPDDVLRFTWTPGNPTASEWYVLLDITTAGPPTEFTASRDGTRVRVP